MLSSIATALTAIARLIAIPTAALIATVSIAGTTLTDPTTTYTPNGRVFTWLALVVWLQLAAYVVIFLAWMRLVHRSACRETRRRGTPLDGADAREYLGTLLILGVLAAAALAGCGAIGRYLLQALWGVGA